MSRGFVFALPALAAGLLIAAPCWAISETEVPAPLSNYGSPQFSNPDYNAHSVTSSPGETRSTFGNGSFSFGVTTSHNDGSGFPYQGLSGRSGYDGFSDQGYSNQGFTNQGFSNQGFSNSGPAGPDAPDRFRPYWMR